MAVISRPPIWTLPSVAKSMQPITFKSVVLPEPEGPTMLMNSPDSTVTSTPRKALTSVSPKG